jgi:hypothetical protein
MKEGKRQSAKGKRQKGRIIFQPTSAGWGIRSHKVFDEAIL